ncbi:MULTISPECIES: hypothetical protein [unclassified Streptomyces]|uniref:hypothetical protein n=1 Tax=unclassified Streptomyces TaxID=2593676 RepID=UPI0007486EDA|nr:MULTISPECIES: hypothetical protein [unclassified Streptomyces]KUL80402.1 hypothetical protein ADL34_00300 [Streptomyces sp. NRRL WC-3605]KUL81176.1 hypothetical protein ADL33_01780 [Streptomyces sp. NRRL WC-3604]
MSDDQRRTDVRAPGTRGMQVGDHNTQHNTFVLTAGALAVAAVVGTAVLTFTLQRWDDDKPTPGPTATLSARRPTPPEEPSRTPTQTPTTAPPSTPAVTDDPGEGPSGSPSFDPATLDDEDTDRTPVTVAALLPASFTDAKGVRYTRNSGSVMTCGSLSWNSEATAALASAGCVDSPVVSGTYVDTAQNVLVAVEVMALPDQATAVAAHARLKDDNTGGWRYRCPVSGTGSDVCGKDALSRATQFGYTAWKHRYLISAVAVYVDLRQDDSVKSWLVSASQRGSTAAGPENHPANNP